MPGGEKVCDHLYATVFSLTDDTGKGGDTHETLSCSFTATSKVSVLLQSHLCELRTFRSTIKRRTRKPTGRA